MRNIPFSPPDMTELEVEGASEAIRYGSRQDRRRKNLNARSRNTVA